MKARLTMSPLRLSLVGLLILASVGASAWNRAKAATAAAEQSPAELTGGWRLVQTRSPRGGPDAVSVMRTADTSRSDLDLAGLLIRCNGERSELAIVLLNAFPLRARPQVIFGKPGHETRFEASVGPPGTTIVLPGEPKTVLGEAWSAESDLFIRVTEGPKSISGVVPIGGIQSAFILLKANCPT
jgi:hypothetical protein